MAVANLIAPTSTRMSRVTSTIDDGLGSRIPDRLVFRTEYRDQIAMISDETVRNWLRQGKLPPFDYQPTRKRQAWKRSTLSAHGHFVPELLVKAQ